MNACKGKGFILITEDECKQKGGKVIDPRPDVTCPAQLDGYASL